MTYDEAADLPHFITSCKYFVVGVIAFYGCKFSCDNDIVYKTIISCNNCPLNGGEK